MASTYPDTVRFTYNTTSTDPEAQHKSVAAFPAGALTVKSDHWLAKAYPGAVVLASGARRIDVQLIDYVLMEGLEFDAVVDEKPPYWHIRPLALSRIFKALLEAGMPPLSNASPPVIRDTVQEYLQKLDRAQRVIAGTDVVCSNT